jgi:ERCC4-type nuclease
MDKQLLRSQKLVDHREPESLRSKLLELGWTQARLYSADYSFWTVNFKTVGIERKTPDDLINSLGQRFSDQLLRMTEQYDFNILVIEGTWRMIAGKIITYNGMQYYEWDMIWNFLRTWQDKGLTIEITTNQGHTVRRLNGLYAYYQKAYHAGGVNRKVAGDPRILALQCGGIGVKLGTALLEKFGSLKAIANATAQEFSQIEKIGSKKAIAIYNHFNKGNNIGQLDLDNDMEDDNE